MSRNRSKPVAPRRRSGGWLASFDAYPRLSETPSHSAAATTLRTLRVVYLGVQLYKSPPRLIECRMDTTMETMIVMLAGRYVATAQIGGEGGERREKIEARAGDVVYWPLGTTRLEHNDAADPMRTLVVCFDLPARMNEVPSKVFDRQRLITSLAQVMHLTQDTLLPNRQQMLDAYASAIVAEYLRLANAGGEELVTKVVRYTQEHVRRHFSLAELARHVGLKKRYFGRRYKSLTGRTPMQDVRRIRIEHAIGIMHGAPDMPLKDVAFRVGMANCHLLSRWLKRQMNLTSREIRAS